VTVQAEVDLVGKIVKFGRGMIEKVSRQLFRQIRGVRETALEMTDNAGTWCNGISGAISG
jgi:hypothetical protein